MDKPILHIMPCLRAFEGVTCVAERGDAGDLGGARWSVGLECSHVSPEVSVWTLHAHVVDGSAGAAAAGFLLRPGRWSEDHYLLLPGAVYAGNRFESLKVPYSPRPGEAQRRPDPPVFISDIPRLRTRGASRIELPSGALPTPAVAAFDPENKTGWMILFPPTCGDFETGLDLRENERHEDVEIRITAPGVRERRYRFMDTNAASPDRGAAFGAGDRVSFQIVVHQFACASICALFERFFSARQSIKPSSGNRGAVSLSLPARLVEAHYNRDLWWEEAGLYRTDVATPHRQHPYQNGWCGGVIAEYALLRSSFGEPTRTRAKQHLNQVFSTGIAPSGLFYGRFGEAGWQPDGHGPQDRDTWRRHLTLVRRQGDALLYGLKALDALEARGEEIPRTWLNALRKAADALVAIWQRHGQFGQWVDQFTGEVVVGNSASGAIIPAALVAAHARFGGIYLEVASESAAALYRCCTMRGVTTGGPGDALQAPDSESSYAMVESFMALFAATGDPRWLECAQDAAHQFASWVMSYDYRFPEGSLFARLGIRSTGAVFANAQNTHASPGICTHSARALFDLARATGDARYEELALDITSVLAQCLSTDDRPMVAKDGEALPSGWMNERVNTSDWDDNHGGVFHGPCWCEVSLLLSHAEHPASSVHESARASAPREAPPAESMQTVARGAS